MNRETMFVTVKRGNRIVKHKVVIEPAHENAGPNHVALWLDDGCGSLVHRRMVDALRSGRIVNVGFGARRLALRRADDPRVR